MIEKWFEWKNFAVSQYLFWIGRDIYKSYFVFWQFEILAHVCLGNDQTYTKILEVST